MLGTLGMEVIQGIVVMLETVEMQVTLGTLGMLVPLGTLGTLVMLETLVTLGTSGMLGTPGTLEILGTLENLEMLGMLVTSKTLVTPRMHLVTLGTLGMPETLGLVVTLGPLVMLGTPGDPEGTLGTPCGWAESGQALREQRGPGSSTHPQNSPSARAGDPRWGYGGHRDGWTQEGMGTDGRVGTDTHGDRLGTPRLMGTDWDRWTDGDRLGTPRSRQQKDTWGCIRRCGDTWSPGDRRTHEDR